MKVCMISGADGREPYGSTTRPTAFARHLAERGAEVTHFCPCQPAAAGAVARLEVHGFASDRPRDRLRQVLRHCWQWRPDVLYTHQLEAGKLGVVLGVLLRRPHVWDAHSSVVLEAPTLVEIPPAVARRRAWYEKLVVRLSRRIIVPSAELRSFLTAGRPDSRGRFAVVKNGVDTSTYCPRKPDPALKRALGLEPDAVVFACTDPRLPNFPANEMALRYLFAVVPAIEAAAPQARFLILGGGPRPAPPSARVTYAGYVKDLPAHLCLADVCVAPYPPEAVCGGTRNKICDYLACGRPVIATAEAMRGFDDAVPGRDYLLAKDPQDFVALAVHGAHHADALGPIGRNARLLSARYDWRVLGEAIAAELEQAAQCRLHARWRSG